MRHGVRQRLDVGEGGGGRRLTRAANLGRRGGYFTGEEKFNVESEFVVLQ